MPETGLDRAKSFPQLLPRRGSWGGTLVVSLSSCPTAGTRRPARVDVKLAGGGWLSGEERGGRGRGRPALTCEQWLDCSAC